MAGEARWCTLYGETEQLTVACLASEYLGKMGLDALWLRDFARHARFEFGTRTQTIKLTPYHLPT
jgi:hypothetical protein